MAEETKKTPQTPEEIAREAQAQAMKAALEQAQALYGNVPGFEAVSYTHLTLPTSDLV